MIPQVRVYNQTLALIKLWSVGSINASVLSKVLGEVGCMAENHLLDILCGHLLSRSKLV